MDPSSNLGGLGVALEYLAEERKPLRTHLMTAIPTLPASGISTLDVALPEVHPHEPAVRK